MLAYNCNKNFEMHILLPIVLSASLLFPSTTFAWDSVGHRLSAAIVVRFLSDGKREALIGILRAHPRFEEDFLNQIPDFVDQNNEMQLQTWMLGQAAYWPDIARGIPSSDRARFNRPTWHYTDGVWVRGAAQTQGNSYVGVSPSDTIQGEAASSIRSERQVHNVVTAIDYNTRLLTDSTQDLVDRAVALCWILHLMGDIHQPLHTGSLFSRVVLEDGDAGGNRISTNPYRNLHAAWDGALRDDGIDASLPLVLESVAGFTNSELQNAESDWTLWMAESREILLSIVYTEEMKSAIRAADREGTDLEDQSLSAEYVAGMKNVSRQRLGLAGLRMAMFFENELN